MPSLYTSSEHQIPPGELKEDVKLLFQAIQEAHPAPFAYQDEETLSSTLQELDKTLNHPSTARGFYRLLAPVVSSLKNGHTWVARLEEFERWVQSEGMVIPISLDWNGEHVWLTAHYGSSSAPLGAIITEINGEDAGDVVRRMGRHVPMEGRNSNPWLIRRNDWLWYWLWVEYGKSRALELTLSDTAGTNRQHDIKAVSLSDLGVDPRRERPDYAFGHLPEYAAAIVEFSLFSDPAKCCNFIDETFAQIRRTGVKGIVLDLRRCRGGISPGVERLLRYLLDVPFVLHSQIHTKASQLTSGEMAGLDPETKVGKMARHQPLSIEPADKAMRFAGNVVVLIGPLTYSNAVSCAHALRHYRKAVLIGEETGDSTASYGGQQSFQLPNSGLSVGIATQFVVCPGAEDGGGTLVPDDEVKPTPEDTLGGNDPAIWAALQLLKGAYPAP